jgi:hypothetical protein
MNEDVTMSWDECHWCGAKKNKDRSESYGTATLESKSQEIEYPKS